MHPIEKWLIIKRISKTKFSTMCDLSIVTVYKILRSVPISRRTAMKIEIATDRQVTMKQLQEENGFCTHYMIKEIE